MEGNAYAIDLGFQLRSLTDGGEQEDLDVSLGKNIRTNPTMFLTMVNKYDMRRQKDTDTIFLNYGDEFVDDIDKQIEETDMRIKALRKVKIQKLQSIKHYVINILHNHKKMLAEINKELKESDVK